MENPAVKGWSPPDSVSKLNFWKNTTDKLTGSDLANAQGRLASLNILKQFSGQAGRYNSLIKRVEKGIALAR